MSNSKSVDHYGLSNNTLKKTIHLVSSSLAVTLNSRVKTGYFPDFLKTVKITPVFKNGDEHLPQNYRPISIVPIYSLNYFKL